MINFAIRSFIKALPAILILHFTALILEVPLKELTTLLYVMLVFVVGSVYGVMLVYKSPSPEFMQMIIEEEKDLKRQENK